MKRTVRVLFCEIPILGAILLAVAGFAVGYALRYAFIEPDILGIICGESAHPPLWCGPRGVLVAATHTPPLPPLIPIDLMEAMGTFGRRLPSVITVLVLALAVLCWLIPERKRALWVSMAALLAGGMGLILYNASAAVIAVVVGAVRLIGLERTPGKPR